MKKIYIILFVTIILFNGIVSAYLIKSHKNARETVAALQNEIKSLTLLQNVSKTKILELEDKIKSDELILNEIDSLIKVDKQEELTLVNSSNNYYYETKPLLRDPSIHISLKSDILPDRFRVYQTVDGKTVNIVYQKDNIIEVLNSFSLIKPDEDNQREILVSKGDYAIIENEKLTLDLVNEEDIEYVQTYSDLLNQVRLDIKFHYEIVIDGVVQE